MVPHALMCHILYPTGPARARLCHLNDMHFLIRVEWNALLDVNYLGYHVIQILRPRPDPQGPLGARYCHVVIARSPVPWWLLHVARCELDVKFKS